MAKNKKSLSPAQLEARRRAGLACWQKYGSAHMSRIGRKGYDTTIARYGRVFHFRGGQAFVKLFLFTDPQTGACGIEAARAAGLIKGKKHRYLKP